MGVHQKIYTLDRHVWQSGNQRVSIGPPVTDRDGDIIACFYTGLAGAKITLEEVGHVLTWIYNPCLKPESRFSLRAEGPAWAQGPKNKRDLEGLGSLAQRLPHRLQPDR